MWNTSHRTEKYIFSKETFDPEEKRFSNCNDFNPLNYDHKYNDASTI